MKNKSKKLLYLILINIFIMSAVISQEIKFEANFIELIDEDKRIIAKKNISKINHFHIFTLITFFQRMLLLL